MLFECDQKLFKEDEMENIWIIGALILGAIIAFVDFIQAHIFELIGIGILFVIFVTLNSISNSIQLFVRKENSNQYLLTQIEQHLRNIDERAARGEQKNIIINTHNRS